MQKSIYLAVALYANYSSASWLHCLPCYQQHNSSISEYEIAQTNLSTTAVEVTNQQRIQFMNRDDTPIAIPVLPEIITAQFIRSTNSPQTNVYNQHGQIIEPIPVHAQPLRTVHALTTQERHFYITSLANLRP